MKTPITGTRKGNGKSCKLHPQCEPRFLALEAKAQEDISFQTATSKTLSDHTVILGRIEKVLRAVCRGLRMPTETI